MIRRRRPRLHDGRSDEEFDDEVLDLIWHARESEAGGIEGQAALVYLLNCSAIRLTTRMPVIVAKSRLRYPGYCLQVAPRPNGNLGRPPALYQITDEQSADQIKGTKRRGSSGQTIITRAYHELDVRKAKPGAKAAVALMQSSIDLWERAMELI